jgi:hypothetical protein
MYLACGCEHKQPGIGYLAATASATPAQVVPAPAVKSSASSIPAIVTQLCGSSPNYCSMKSGANKAGFLQAFLTEALTTRMIPYPATSQNAQMIMEADARTDCSSYASAPGTSAIAKTAAITSTVAKTAGTVASTIPLLAATPIPIIGPIIAGIGALVGFVTGIFSKHHAQAVAGEQADICSAIPKINAILQQIDAGLAAGSISPSQAQSAYSTLQTQLASALKQHTTFKTGDALWAFNLALTGILQVRNQDLQNGVLTSGAPGPWTPAGASALGSIASALGLSPSAMPWLVLGGAAALAFLL